MRLLLLALFASTCTAQHSPPPIGPEPRPAHTADAAPPPPTDLCVAWCVRLHELNCPSIKHDIKEWSDAIREANPEAAEKLDLP